MAIVDVASAATIRLRGTGVYRITGTATIQTITGVRDGDEIILLPAGAFLMNTAGNIAPLTLTATVGRPVHLAVLNSIVYEVGPSVASGATGPPGPAGVDGAMGVPGFDGQPGDTGDAGPPGNVGAPGATGSPGANGIDGLIGPPGIDGADGAEGVSGPPGMAGTNGAAGATGATGPEGLQGPPGGDGADGEDGAQGPPGTNGATGASGANGANGLDGYTIRGTDGEDGQDSYVPGPTGPQGPAGGGGGGTFTRAVVTLPYSSRSHNGIIVTAAGCTTASNIVLSLAGVAETDTNSSDMVDMLAMQAVAGTGQFEFQANFMTPIGGPLSINYAIG